MSMPRSRAETRSWSPTRLAGGDGDDGAATAGTLLADRYELVRRIAAGSMGVVWSARDVTLGRTVAVKLLRDELPEGDVALTRFRAEARHAAGLSHPGIATVFDYGETQRPDGGRHAFIVMELVDGEALSEVLAREPVLPLTTTVSILAQIGDVLHAAHARGIVHRDVKPANVLVRPDGTIKVTDFGIAQLLHGDRLTRTRQVIGTARYMSPEQATGAPATASSDVYSLGVVGYEMLAGRPPFVAEHPAALALAHVRSSPPPLPDSVPDSVRAIIRSALAKDPAERPADAGSLAAALRSALLDRTATFAAPSTDARPGNAPVATTDVMVATAAAGLPVAAGSDGALSGQLRAERRRGRRARVLVAGSLVALVAGVAAVNAASDDGAELPGGSVPVETTVPTVAPVTTLTAVTAVTAAPVGEVPVPTPNAKEKGKGKGRGG